MNGMKNFIFIVFQVLLSRSRSEQKGTFHNEEVIKKIFLWKKQPLKLAINVSLFCALNKQYPYNKRWQKVCFILISVRHEAQKNIKSFSSLWIVEKFFIYSLLGSYKNLLIASYTTQKNKKPSISILLTSSTKGNKFFLLMWSGATIFEVWLKN